MLLQNRCKFGRALQNVFAILFLNTNPLIMAFEKALKCINRTTVSVSKVIKVVLTIHGCDTFKY